MAASPPPHLVLARKWRPERFSDLAGQEHVTRTLSEALKRGRIAHAFLFTGIRGVGKTTAARILARCLNCEKGPTAEPCGECAACVEIRAGRALDVSEIDGATYRKIDDARAIIENLSYRPARDRFKIYIIDEAHQLTDQAFNALLKTLEEPPPHVKFILATTEPQKMPETILSRLQRYDFRRIPYPTILERLKELARREGIESEEAALRVLAREAGGSMRDAERMLETAIASAPSGKVIEAEVAESLGVAGRTAVLRLAESILNKDAGGALRMIREHASRGANLESLGRDLLETIRNIAAAKLPSGESQSLLDDLPDHEAADIRRLSESAGSRDLMRLFNLMAAAQEQIIRSPYPDLLFEMAAVRMASLAQVLDPDELMRALRTGVIPATAGGGAGAPPAPVSGGASRGAATAPSAGARRMRVEGEVKAEAPMREPVHEATAGDMPELREFIRSRRAALAGFMEQGAALALAGEVLTVTARNDIYIRYLSDNKSAITELASEHFGRPIRVDIVANGGARAPVPTPVSAPKPAAPAPRAASSSPASGSPSPFSSVSPPARSTTGASPEEKQALMADPAIRNVFDALDARLVELKTSPKRSE
ncbi:MAG TPA: DNA polymerase III subunit gamma/tau [Candidatus Binataceae bacterium]|nr:DNA polymerase III subunit gamma/tau [Candidatus Binataceae bacterium]